MSRGTDHIIIENDNFSQNIVTFHFILVDVSGSMSGEKEKGVRQGLELIKSRLMKLEDTSSTRISLIEFGDRIRFTNLKSIEAFDPRYSARNEMTAMYDAFVFVKNELLRLYEKYKNKFRINVNVIVLSDGKDNYGDSSEKEAKEAIKVLQTQLEAGTLFYAIEEPEGMRYLTKKAQDLGFIVESLDNTERSIIEASNSLSRSLVRSSQSGIPIGASQTELSGSMSISGLASEDYRKAMANMQYDDPFAAEFESA